MSERPVYIGKDLEAMSFAANYHRWILREFRPFIGRRIVEVGAGTGNFSRLLIAENPASLTLVEPSDMFHVLVNGISEIKSETQITFHNSIFIDARDEIADQCTPDTIVYINVLEHIEDDRSELQAIYQTLQPGGHCLIFVPAFMALYGEFDLRVGHFRRYSKHELSEKCSAAGFEVVRSRYFDFAGIVPWYVKYKLLGSDNLSPGAVAAYDRYAVPFMSRVESLLRVPVGKNILAVLRRPQGEAS